MADEEREEIKRKYEAQLKEMQSMVSSTWEERASVSREHEAQLSRATEEHKRQARQMEEECRKRFKLLQEQDDLELTIRALLDTVHSLPAPPEGAEGLPCAAL